MDRAVLDHDGEDDRIVLNLLNSVDDGAQSQRRIAEDLGIALGLVNAYLKRCVKKGLVKVRQAPAPMAMAKMVRIMPHRRAGILPAVMARA